MALKDTWVDKVNGVDEANAEDINEIAQAVIELEKNVGDIETALLEIEAITDSLIGGGAG